MTYWFQKKTSKKGISFILVLSIMYMLLISGVPAERAYAADIPTIKHGALVVPIAYKNNINTPDSGTCFIGPCANPAVRFPSAKRYYDLNDIFNTDRSYTKRVQTDSVTLSGVKYVKMAPMMSVNSFLRNASYGQDSIQPIYLTSDRSLEGERQFIPFDVGMWREELESEWKMTEKRNDPQGWTPFWKTYLQSALDQASEIGALPSETITAFMDDKNRYLRADELVVTGADTGFRINSVVFLVNVSHDSKAQALKLQSFTIREASDYGVSLSLRTAKSSVVNKSWNLKIENYAVIFAGYELPNILLHEIMHLMGVEDLYLANLGVKGKSLPMYPAWRYDVQSEPDSCSGPFYTQRLNMYHNPLKNQLAVCAAKERVEYRSASSGGIWNTNEYRFNHLSLNDINFIGENSRLVYKIEVGLDGEQVDYYLEYRRPETDIYVSRPAKLSYYDKVGGRQKDGYLLLYTTGPDYYNRLIDKEEPPQKYKPVYMIKSFVINHFLDPDATAERKPTAKVVVDGDRQKGIRLIFDEGLAPYYNIDFTLSDPRITNGGTAASQRNRASNLTLDFDLSITITRCNELESTRHTGYILDGYDITRIEGQNNIVL